MDQDWKIEGCKAEYVYTHIRVAHHLFQSSHWHRMAQKAFWAKVATAMVEVHPCRWASSVSVDTLLCHFGEERSRPFHFHEPLPGVFPLQPSACYALEKQHPTSSLLGLRHEVSQSVVAFPHLRRGKTLLEPLWPSTRQDACRTVQAVPDLLDLP